MLLFVALSLLCFCLLIISDQFSSLLLLSLLHPFLLQACVAWQPYECLCARWNVIKLCLGKGWKVYSYPICLFHWSMKSSWTQITWLRSIDYCILGLKCRLMTRTHAIVLPHPPKPLLSLSPQSSPPPPPQTHTHFRLCFRLSTNFLKICLFRVFLFIYLYLFISCLFSFLPFLLSLCNSK